MSLNQTVADNYDRPLEIQICLSLILACIIALTIFGNSLVCLAIIRCSRLRRQVSSIFLFNLALTDIGCALLVMPFSLTSVWYDTWVFGAFWCNAVCFFNYCFIIVSMATLANISVDRYIFVIYPLRYEYLVTRTRAKIFCFLGWVMGFAFGVAPAIAKWVWYDNSEIVCAINWENEKSTVIAYTVTAFIVCFMFPMMVMWYAYYHIYKVAKSQANKIAQQTQSVRLRDYQNEQRTINNKPINYNMKAIKTILIMISAYAICNTPFSLTKLVKVVSGSNESVPEPINIMASWLAFTNPCCNPIIYAINREDFKKAFCKLLSLRRSCRRWPLLSNREGSGMNLAGQSNEGVAAVYSISRVGTVMQLTSIPRENSDDTRAEREMLSQASSGSACMPRFSFSDVTIGLRDGVNTSFIV